MERFNAADFRAFIKEYLYLMRPYRAALVSLMCWILLMQMTALGEPYALKYVVDGILSHKIATAGSLVIILSALYAFLTIGSAVQIAKNRRIVNLVFRLNSDLFKRCAKKLLALPLSFYERSNAGLLISKVAKGVGKTEDVTSTLLYEIVPLAIQTTVTSVIIGCFSLRALAMFLIAVALFTSVTYHVKRRLAPARKRRHDEDSQSYEYLGEMAVNIATVQTCAQEEREWRKIADLWDGIIERSIGEFRTHFRFDYGRNSIVNLGRDVVLGICAWPVMRQAVGDAMSIGTFVFIISLADKVFVGCYRIGAIFDRVQEASDSVARMVALLETEETIKDPPNPVEAPEFRGAVSFEGVTHQYPAKRPREAAKRNGPALSEISLEVRPGETIGLVGPSGGGKSTLVKLLLRIDDPTFGRIRIDGIDLRLMRRADFRRQIGYVSQEVEIFDGSVAYNIAYGRSDASQEQIAAASKAANIHEFISSLPDGYDELVGNRGMRLSGGQRQRIGIARALIMNPRILVLDEATSQVDSISEAKIQGAIENLRGARTIIMIAHRLSTVKNADRIVVIDEGRIREIGTHAQLKEKAGLYLELMRQQQMAEDVM